MFRPMRRGKQLLPPEESIQILEQGTSGVLAVAGDAGYPYAVPLSYVYTDGKLYFHCAKSGHKLDAIRRNSKTSFCVIGQDAVVPLEYTTYFRSVIAFGQILPKSLLDRPKYGCVNIHASLLPKYRGAAPIQWAVINGDKETGITTMMMDVEMDTGDMLEKMVVKLNPDETGGSLFDRLSLLGGSLILSTLGKLEKGEIIPQPQDHEKATYVKKISKSMGDIDWTMDAVSIERLVRGLNPWPSAVTRWNGRMLKIWEAKVLPDPAVKAPCGSVISAGEEGLKIQTGNGVLCVTSLQLEGKKRMDTAAFLRGYQIEPGCIMERSE